MRPAGERPRISVIIATFNRSRMLRCAIQSAVRQEFSAIEVLVIGDHCTDDSAAVVSELDGRVRWFNRDRNCGSQWAPNNDGIAHANSDYIAFLGHDDLWFPWHLTSLVPLLDAGADLAHSMGALIAPEGVRRTTASIPPSTWLVRRTVLQALGGFRDQDALSRGTDDDLFLRIARAGYDIQTAPRLSVLKFPSHWWRAYSSEVAPQEQWLAAIGNDALQVEREVRVAVASTTSSSSPLRSTLRAMLRELRRRFEDRRVIAWILRARFRYQRRALRKLRGL